MYCNFSRFIHNESSKKEYLTFKGFQSPTLDFYFIGIITIVVDFFMLINKSMSYYINKNI